MKPGCIGKSNINNLPAPTDLTENPFEKINLWVLSVNKVLNLVPREVPRFEGTTTSIRAAHATRICPQIFAKTKFVLQGG